MSLSLGDSMGEDIIVALTSTVKGESYTENYDQSDPFYKYFFTYLSHESNKDSHKTWTK